MLAAVMPSAIHQALVTLLLERPEVLASACAPGSGRALPGGTHIRAASAAFTELTPPSYHADVVLRVEDGNDRLRHLVIGEVQLRRDRRKHISWPTQGGCIVPLVLGPEVIPRIVDVEAARAQPGLAVLSALAHARSEDAPEIAAAALAACRTIDSQHGPLYADLVKARLPPAIRRAVEKKVMSGMYDYDGYRLQTPEARAYWAKGHKKGRAEGRREGRAEGRQEGREEGHEKGRAKGLREGRKEGREEGRKETQQAMAQMLAVQLEQRFGPLPKYAMKAIETADVSALSKMGSRLLAAASLKDVIARPARRSRASDTAAGTRPHSRARGMAKGTRPRSRASAGRAVRR